MTLDLRWRQPGADRLLFLVHGYGEHPMAALLMGTILDPDARTTLCAPKGGLDLGSDRRSFYRVDFKARKMEPESFAAALVDVDLALDAACAESGTNRADAIVAGFSQGGGLSLATCFRHSDRPPPAGLLVFSGMMYDDESVDWRMAQPDTNREVAGADAVNRAIGPTKVFWAHGTDDEIFSLQRHRTAVARLRHHGIDTTVIEFNGKHVLSPDGLAAGRDWLAANWLDV